jgi:hypothetical protein
VSAPDRPLESDHTGDIAAEELQPPARREASKLADLGAIDTSTWDGLDDEAFTAFVEQAEEGADARLDLTSFDARDGGLCHPGPSRQFPLAQPGPTAHRTKFGGWVHTPMIVRSLSPCNPWETCLAVTAA